MQSESEDDSDQSNEDDYLVSTAKRDDCFDDLEDLADNSDLEDESDSHCSGDSSASDTEMKVTPKVIEQVAKNVTQTPEELISKRHQFVRKLIRDDRRESREVAHLRTEQRQGKVSSVSVADTVNKLKTGRIATGSGSGTNKLPNKALASTVRLSVQSDKGGSGSSKLLVVARALPLPDLLQLSRSKFQLAPSKADGLVVVESGELLQDLDLLSIPDGTLLRLCLVRNVAVKSSIVDDVEEEEEEVRVSHSKHKHDNKLEANDKTLTSSPSTYWTPPSSSSSSSASGGSDYDHSLSTAKIAPDVALSAQLKEELQSLYASLDYAELKAHRESLPIYAARDDLLYHIKTNQVVVVSGETGSGKTTQLPMYIYEDMCIEGERGAECYIVVTQPRRIAAITVAERVAFECDTRSVNSGGRGRSNRSSVGELVGYQIRLDSRCSKNTRILYCTTGVLLRKLQSSDFLSRVSHILVDEVHERQVETDFLMTLLKQKLSSAPKLRVVLMSATMQEGLFTAYFDACPLVCVSGRTFPVAEHHLDEVHKLVAAGQRMSANERGKGGQGGGCVVVSGDAYAAGVRKSDKKYAEKNRDNQANLLSIQPPRFDADTIAELVIRIITTHSKPQGQAHSQPGVVGASYVLPASKSVANNSGETDTTTKSSGASSISSSQPVVSSRMANIRKAAESAGKPVKGDDLKTVQKAVQSPVADVLEETPLSIVKVETRGDAILVFLSGLQAIEKVSRAIRQRNVLQKLNAQLFILHGSMPPEQQRKVFKTTLPGQWKIVLATNIAETSITVDDVTHVVDSGFVKEMRYDPVSNLSSLQEVFISRAAAKQRSGRAGRVRAGHSWRVFSKEFFASDRVDDFSEPEIRRIPLEEVVLQVLLLRLGRPEEFLGQCLQAPSLEQIKASICCLLEIGAILPLPELPLTALGYHLAKMPVDVRLGKMLIYSSLLQCVEPVLTIVAALGGKSPLISPPEQRGESNKAHTTFMMRSNGPGKGASNCHSDHLAVVAAYDAWLRMMQSQGNAAAYAFCRENYLSHNVLLDMQVSSGEEQEAWIRAGGESESFEDDLFDVVQSASQLTLNDSIVRALDSHEKKAGSERTHASLIKTTSPPLEAELAASADLIKCVLCAGLAPQLVRLRRVAAASRSGKSVKRFETGTEPLQIWGSDRVNVALHPSSLVQRYTRDVLEGDGTKKDAFIVFYKKIASSQVYLFDATAVPHVAVLLFGNGCHDFKISAKRDRVVVGGWIEMCVEELHAVLYKRLQQEIECLLRLKVEDPLVDVREREKDLRFIVETLLSGSQQKKA
eukprot:gene21324-27354_t